jgi:hypothetical protein
MAAVAGRYSSFLQIQRKKPNLAKRLQIPDFKELQRCFLFDSTHTQVPIDVNCVIPAIGTAINCRSIAKV